MLPPPAQPGDLDDEESTADHLRHLTPLWLLSREPALNDLMRALQQFRERYDAHADPGALTFSRRQVAAARVAFADMIRRGERHLHQLCTLLADAFLGNYQMQSVVIGEVPALSERFTLAMDITHEQLYAGTDLDLGNRQLARMRLVDGHVLHTASLVSNVVEYQALETNRCNVYKILSRVKAEEEIWNKVADEIFNLDGLVLRDKELRHLSRYVKDVFGIKIVVGGNDDVHKTQKSLALLELERTALEALGLPANASRLEFLEVKDYVRRKHRKRSGWSAMKSVVRFANKMFEIQVQPLGNFLHERELLTRESHLGFKKHREALRERVAAELPLFGHYLTLLRWLFSDTQDPPPHLPGVVVRVTD